MTDPSNPDAPSWLQDIETTKALLTHPSLGNNQLALRCYEVINRLLGPSPTIMSGIPPHQQNSQQPFHQQQPQQGFMPFPEQLFGDGFGGSLFPVEQHMPSPGGMDFSEWVNYPGVE
jgi:transcriptional regulatory protein GAL4